MSMTKSDYELIASNISVVRALFDGTTISDEASETLTGLSYQLAKALAQDNPNFKRDRFLTACGIDK